MGAQNKAGSDRIVLLSALKELRPWARRLTDDPCECEPCPECEEMPSDCRCDYCSCTPCRGCVAEWALKVIDEALAVDAEALAEAVR